MIHDGIAGQFTRVELSRNPECFVCGDLVEEAIRFPVKLSESVLDLKKKIAEMFSIPDPELLYGRWRLSDEQKISEIGIKEDDIIYISTSRRFMPLQLRVELVEE